jgi:hypothetical protein
MAHHCTGCQKHLGLDIPLRQRAKTVAQEAMADQIDLDSALLAALRNVD